MRLGAILSHPSPVWQQFFIQEGLPWELAGESDESFLLVVTRPLDDEGRERVQSHLKNGRAVISFAGHVEGIPGMSSRRSRVKYLLGEDPVVDGGLVDVETVLNIPREANRLRTDGNEQAMFVGELLGGLVTLLPFDPAEVLSDWRTLDRNFYSDASRLPWEKVSAVGKGEIQRLIRRAIEHLFHLGGLPYIHLWYYPSRAVNVFAFRIDTDGASPAQVAALRETADRCGVRCSWYLDVKSHETWLDEFAGMAGHEMGVHCYEHRVPDDNRWNAKNISRARDHMNRARLDPRGFAAPYGIWRPGFGRVIDEAGFDYSSEFGWAYDALPSAPIVEEQTYATLQIPVHPISIGSLSRVGYTPTMMRRYYEDVAQRKMTRGEPMFFYTHPHNGHHDVLESLFEWSRARGVVQMTFGEFAAWWKKRVAAQPRWTMTGSVVSASGPPADDTVVAHITRPGKARFVAVDAPIDTETFVLAPTDHWTPPGDLRRMREPDPRRWLAGAFTALSRRFR